MNTKHLLVGFICLMFLASCGFMPRDRCPVTARAYVKNNSDGPIQVTIAKIDGGLTTFVTRNPTTLSTGESGRIDLEVGDYLVIIWDVKEGFKSKYYRFETSIRCKSKVWEYKNSKTLHIYDYIGDFQPDMMLLPTIL